MNYYEFNYEVNEHTGTMTIYNNDNHVVAEVSLCQDLTEDELNNLADEILAEKGLITDNYFTDDLAQ